MKKRVETNKIKVSATPSKKRSRILSELRLEEGELRSIRKELEKMIQKRTARLQEITREVEAAVQDSREYAENIVETVREPLLVLDSSLRVLSANKSFYDIFKVFPEVTEGQYIYDLGSRQWDIPDLRKLLENILSKERAFNDFEVDHDFEGIGEKIMLLNARKMIQDRGLILLAIEDITERRQVEMRAEQIHDELAAAHKELETFTYSASHDLRAPLRFIKSFSDILLAEHSKGLDEKGTKMLVTISNSAKKMDDLIMALLALSQAGRQPLRKVEFNIKELARSVFDELRAAMPERQVQFTVTDLPLAVADKTLIRQVLSNLIGNALKFTSPKNATEIEVGGRTEGNENIYYVKDNGAGFDMNYADRLFKPFQRIHTEKEFSGSGIGLSIVHRIIARHGGRVWAEGEPGKGATFYFTLPF